MYVLVPEDQWEAGPGKAIAAFTSTALHLTGYKTAVRDGVEYKGVEKGPDQFIRIINSLKTEWQTTEKKEAGRKEVARKAADKIDVSQGGKQQRVQGPTVATASREGTC